MSDSIEYSIRGIPINPGISREAMGRAVEKAMELAERGLLPVCRRPPEDGEDATIIYPGDVIGRVASVELNAEFLEARVSIANVTKEQQNLNDVYRALLMQGMELTLKAREADIQPDGYSIISLDLDGTRKQETSDGESHGTVKCMCPLCRHSRGEISDSEFAWYLKGRIELRKQIPPSVIEKLNVLDDREHGFLILVDDLGYDDEMLSSLVKEKGLSDIAFSEPGQFVPSRHDV